MGNVRKQRAHECTKQIIREAKESKGNLAALWFDLANAYGSIPHQLVKITLERYHMPTKMTDML